MVEPHKHPPRSAENSSSCSSDADVAERQAPRAVGGTAPGRAPTDADAETAWLSDDSDAVAQVAQKAEEDAPFYDPELDDRDQAWVAKRRQGRRSDAILSCPGCLTSVCLDCQQHAAREGSFRAMFVLNCRVDYGRTVEPHGAAGVRSKRRRGQAKGCAAPQAPSNELFHPVECELCATHLGVYEALQEVYHFYQVVASTA